MKVLWFTNTPCGAAQKLSLNIQTGGWLTSLEKSIKVLPDIDLFISFFWSQKLAKFKHENTTFIPIHKSGIDTKMGRLLNRFKPLIVNEEDLQKLKTIVGEVQPDIIHVHGTENMFGFIQHHTNIPVVISIQGLISSLIFKYYDGIPSNIAAKYEGIKPKLVLGSAKWTFKDFFGRALWERRILINAAYIIGRTSWDYRISRILAPASVYFKGDELMRDSFYLKKWDKNEFNKKIRIVTIISSGLYKGLETIVDSAEILKRAKIFDFEWIVIGQKKGDYLPSLVGRWKKTDFTSLNISLIGIKNENDIVEIMSDADIYCQVSHIENSPNSVCEAMLLGMPIIATFAGGTESILENGKDGILVQTGDPYSMAGAILEIICNFDFAKDLANNAWNRAIERHNKIKVANELINIYQEIIRLNHKK